MERSFHYYGTYCAALIAGYSVEESKELCHSAFLVDKCSRTFLARIGGPESAATTQLPVEMASARTDPIGLQDITRIWSSFHFLPGNLHAEINRGGRNYRNKYRLICGPNGDLVADTVNLAQGKSLQAVGLAMHVLADTWAHRYFAGTPSLVINNTSRFFVELIPSEDGSFTERPVKFGHNPARPDDFDNSMYTNTVFQPSENTIMNLGHGRAGHLPDHSFMICYCAVSGVLSIARAVESKLFDSPWVPLVLQALACLALAGLCVVFINSDETIIWVFFICLFYNAGVRLVSVFKPTEIIYIQ